MKQVAVIHAAFEETPRTVAFVDVPDDMPVMSALEYAYKRTNNIDGSWSKGKTFEFKGETYVNPDYSSDVTVMSPLEVVDGVEYGLRSTSVGDQMLLGTVKYKVAPMGFKAVI
jgi:hypothetical protein